MAYNDIVVHYLCTRNMSFLLITWNKCSCSWGTDDMNTWIFCVESTCIYRLLSTTSPWKNVIVSITKIAVLNSFPTLVSSQMDAKVSFTNTMRRWVVGLSLQTLPPGQSPHLSAVNQYKKYLPALLKPTANLKEALIFIIIHIHTKHQPTAAAFWGFTHCEERLWEPSVRARSQRRECTWTDV